MVDRPDYVGRKEILQVHTRGKTLAKDVDLDKIARRTPGFTGADLSNLLNEAAILAARRNLTEISMDEINDAIDRVLAGPEKENRVMSEERKTLVAYHVVGYALVGEFCEGHDRVQKITIVPRGQALGLTWFSPDDDKSLTTRSKIIARAAVMLGAKVAEEIVFGTENITVNEGTDFEKIIHQVFQMVSQLETSFENEEETARHHEKEVYYICLIIVEAYWKARRILEENRFLMVQLVRLLMERETIQGEELREIINTIKNQKE